MWSQQIGFHQLFAQLEAGICAKEVFTGLILETFHYIRSAPYHTAPAITHCRNPKWISLLSNYLVEEKDHSELALQTLLNLGFKREDILQAHPIIGTMSLINMLREIATISPFAYICCTALIESRAEYVESAKAAFCRIASNYSYQQEDIAPLLSHFEIDILANHASLIKQALAGQTHISTDDANFAVNCLHDLKHAFDQFHDQVLQYYSDISNYIPRLKVDYFSL